MKNTKKTLYLLLVLLLFSVLVSVGAGTVNVSYLKVIQAILSETPFLEKFIHISLDENIKTVVVNIRLPRVLLGVGVGASLALAGSLMQGLFKNPLAEPYILGLSSGSAFGASIAILVFPNLDLYALPVFSFGFGLMTIYLVYKIAKREGKIPTNTLLLTGIAFSFFFSSLTSFLMYFSEERIHQIMFWILGGLTGARWSHVVILLPIAALMTATSIPLGKYLDAIMLGEEEAKYVGVEIEKIKKILLIISSLVTSVAVAFSGIIGFVGLIPPHIIRMLHGPKNTFLIPASAMLGAVMLVSSDTVARIIISPTEIPVGIITSLLGAPFFVYLLRRGTV